MPFEGKIHCYKCNEEESYLWHRHSMGFQCNKCFRAQVSAQLREDVVQKTKEIMILREKLNQTRLENEKKIQLEKEAQIKREKDIQLEKVRETPIKIEKEFREKIEKEFRLKKQRELRLKKQKEIRLRKQKKIQLKKQKAIQRKKQKEIQLQKQREIEQKNKKEINLETMEKQTEKPVEKIKEKPVEKPKEKAPDKSKERAVVEKPKDEPKVTTPIEKNILPPRKNTRSNSIRACKTRQNSSVKNPPNKGGKGRRSIFKKNPPTRLPTARATCVTVNQVCHKGQCFRIGDIVSVRGTDDGIYYAQIKGLMLDEYCEKSASISWLLPVKVESSYPREGFDPMTYIIGPDDDLPRKIECFEFVMHAPSDYYRNNSPFPPVDSTPLPPGYIWTRLQIPNKIPVPDKVKKVQFSENQ